MNKGRRKALKEILEQMDDLGAVLEKVKENLQSVKDEEEEALGNMPEQFQESETGERMQEYIGALEDMIDSLGELDVDDLKEKIEEIIEGYNLLCNRQMKHRIKGYSPTNRKGAESGKRIRLLI